MNLTEDRILTKLEMDISGEPTIFIEHENRILKDGEVLHAMPHRDSVAINQVQKIDELTGVGGLADALFAIYALISHEQ